MFEELTHVLELSFYEDFSGRKTNEEFQEFEMKTLHWIHGASPSHKMMGRDTIFILTDIDWIKKNSFQW